MLRPWVFVGFTGHRNLANPQLIGQRIEECWERIARRTHHAPPAAVSSAAIGADTLFVQSALRREIPWTLLLPFPESLFTKAPDFPDAAAVDIFHSLARQAVRQPKPAQTGAEILTRDERRNGFLECGLRTVEESDVLVAVWDGQPPLKPGGTSRIVTYARELKKPLIWIHATTGKITEERCATLARDFPAEANPPAEPGSELAELEATFDFFRKAAGAHQPFARNLTMSLVGLHQFSIAVAIVALLWHDPHLIQTSAGVTKVAALLLALLLPRFFHHAQENWMGNRLQAEMCRSVRAIWNLRHPEEIFPALRLPAFENLQRSLLLLRLRVRPAPLHELASVRAEYASKRIQHQVDYYAKQAGKAGRQRRWITGLAIACTSLAIICGLALFLPWLAEGSPAFKIVKLCALTLPLMATALIAMVTTRDLERRAARYHEMAVALKRAKVRLEARETWSGLAEVVIDVERMLLLEIWEWYSVSRYSASH